MFPYFLLSCFPLFGLQAQSSVSHETNVKYPNVNTNTKLGATKNRASGGNSRNPTELMLPSAIDELIPVDFKFYGILEFGPKRGKRNKLHWESCFAQLTRTHLMLWDIPSDLCKRIHELYDKYLDLSNFIASTINSNMNSLNPRFEMPINALYHARSVNSCDVCHERPEDLPRVFQIIYDRQCLNNNNNGINVNGNNTVPSGMKQSSSGVSGVGGGGLSNSNSG
ncbi:unnamed protein product [Trichobilharzia regenti]|nr:unnamed protein product [Trichobilharzia regenti]